VPERYAIDIFNRRLRELADYVGRNLEIAVLVLINHSAGANLILGTAPIAGSVWLFFIPFAAGILILEELRKWLARQKAG
jgi:hypothetical protein